MAAMPVACCINSNMPRKYPETSSCTSGAAKLPQLGPTLPYTYTSRLCRLEKLCSTSGTTQKQPRDRCPEGCQGQQLGQ